MIASTDLGGGADLLLEVGSPAHGGHCVARPAGDPTGPVVFVRHALPGETVRARTTERTKRVWRAEAVEVLSASPDRVEPVWPEAGPGGVGGGELSHVALPAQRTWKRWVLADCLRRVGGAQVADAVADLIGAPAPAVEALPSEVAAESADQPRRRARAGTGTRTRVALEVDEDGRPGMHAFRSAQVLAVGSLPLAVSGIANLDLVGDSPRRAWRHHLRPGDRVQAVAPSGSEPVVVVTRGRSQSVLTAAGRPTNRRRVRELVDASGLGLGELSYTVHATGFWQVHRDAPGALVDRVVRAVLTGGLRGGALPERARDGLSVLELYSGAGLFTLPLALAGAQVTSLEGAEQAVGDARRNLHEHPTARLLAGRVTASSLTSLGQELAGGDPTGTSQDRGAVSGRSRAADVVLLDPPRSGAGRETIGAVAALGAPRVVMVACDPAAGARDLAALLEGGYRLTDMCALDMFPHTHHFETMMVLER